MHDTLTTDPSYTPWGPFISDDYVVEPLSRIELVVISTAFGLASVFALLAAYVGAKQTMASRRPSRSPYIWMIWLEWTASVVVGIECLLYMIRVIRPSFYLYISLLLNWSIQIQIVLQIIINRIRVILDNKERGRQLIIGTAVTISIINISVFCIWMPARLQISERWIRINSIWDRIEKGLYLIVDGFLNYYFVRVVKANLVKNGLRKYNHLVRFNQRIIVVSLLMDVMIIGSMSFRNSFVYTLFHPLGFLVKLNIELSMAQLIKTVALGNPQSSENLTAMLTFGTAPAGFRMPDNNIYAEPQRPRFDILRALSDRTLLTASPNPHEITKTSEFDMESVAMSEPESISPKSSEHDIHGSSRAEFHARHSDSPTRLAEPEVVEEAAYEEGFVSLNFTRFRFPPVQMG